MYNDENAQLRSENVFLRQQVEALRAAYEANINVARLIGSRSNEHIGSSGDMASSPYAPLHEHMMPFSMAPRARPMVDNVSVPRTPTMTASAPMPTLDRHMQFNPPRHPLPQSFMYAPAHSPPIHSVSVRHAPVHPALIHSPPVHPSAHLIAEPVSRRMSMAEPASRRMSMAEPASRRMSMASLNENNEPDDYLTEMLKGCLALGPVVVPQPKYDPPAASTVTHGARASADRNVFDNYFQKFPTNNVCSSSPMQKTVNNNGFGQASERRESTGRQMYPPTIVAPAPARTARRSLLNDETDRRVAGGSVAQLPGADAPLPSSWTHTLPHSDTPALLASAARVVGHAALASKKQRRKVNEDVPPLSDTVYLLKYDYKSIYLLSFQRAVARSARPLLPVQLATINIDQAVQDGHAFVRRFDAEIDQLAFMYAHAKPLRASQCVPGLPVVVRQAAGAVAEGFRGAVERMNTHVHVRLMDYGDEVIVRQHHDADVLDCLWPMPIDYYDFSAAYISPLAVRCQLVDDAGLPLSCTDNQLNAALRRLVEMYAKEADGLRAFYVRVHSDPALVRSMNDSQTVELHFKANNGYMYQVAQFVKQF